MNLPVACTLGRARSHACGRRLALGSLSQAAARPAGRAIEGYIAALKEDGIPVPEEHFEVLVAVV